jgi:uncharacterized protein with FMN-binding domain
MLTRLLARRPAVSAVLTVVSVVAVLRLRGTETVPRRAVRAAHPRPHAVAPAHPPRVKPSRTAAPSRTPSARPATRAPFVARTTAPPPPTTKPPVASRSYTGDTYDTPYGPVQVRMTVKGDRITDVVALQLPDGSSRSREINGYAEPQLRQEALDAQSANIDTVSGATYTSDAYASSLQSAIDRWKH